MEPYLGEIKMLAFNWVPTGWAACDGQSMSIVQNQALYSLLGLTYGGGTSTFLLPDLRGCVPFHRSNTIPQGQKAGEAAHSLTDSEIPAHTHGVVASSAGASAPSPSGAIWGTTPENAYAAAANTGLSPVSLSSAGTSAQHENQSPYLTVQFVIALSGVYPVRD